MYKWLQKNNKHVLAFIMIFLMIAFLLPSTFQGCNPTHMAVGMIGKQRVSELDVRNAYYGEWDYVRRNVFVPTNAGGQQSWRPFISATTLRLADQPIEENKMMYYLLREEAHRMGATISPAQLDAVLEQVGFRLPDDRIVDFDVIKNTAEGRAARHALANVLSIEASFVRAVSNIKISQPQRRAEAAMQLQTLTLGLVPFEASAYLDTAAPTRQQIEEHFARYADTLAGAPTKENPFGFGYKFPERVKLQYISVSRDEVRRAVMAQKSDYDWEVEARRHYVANKSSFPTTQQAATQPGATTQSVTLPFDQVKQQAIDAVVSPKVDALGRMVQQRILLALNNDYAAWAKANPTTGPSTSPAAAGTVAAATSLGPAYNSFDYLQALAADVQKQFGVVAKVVNLGDEFRSRAEHDELEGINTAEAMVQGRSLPFAEYVFTTAVEFMPEKSKDRDQAFALHLFQPSQALSTYDGTFAVVRLTAAERTHKPAATGEVALAVEKDVKSKLAYESALADAKKLLEAAAGSNLNAAASSAGKLVIDSGPIRLGRPVEISGLPIGAQSLRGFTLQAFDLLAGEDAEQSRGLIELPLEGRVLAAELRDVRSDLPQDLMAAIETEITTRATAQALQQVAPQWFSYEGVVERTGFKDLYAKAKEDS